MSQNWATIKIQILWETIFIPGSISYRIKNQILCTSNLFTQPFRIHVLLTHYAKGKKKKGLKKFWILVFWGMMPLVKYNVNRYFTGTCYFSHQSLPLAAMCVLYTSTRLQSVTFQMTIIIKITLRCLHSTVLYEIINWNTERLSVQHFVLLLLLLLL